MSGQALHLKICGLTDSAQACAIAALGVQAIGVIGVEGTPRYVCAETRREIYARLAAQSTVARVWVAADPNNNDLDDVLSGQGTPSVVQLHGEESEERCAELRARYPNICWWKALRLRDDASFEAIHRYSNAVDALLIDAWSADQLGGTGHQLDPTWVKHLQDHLSGHRPWWLAGGICAEWVPKLDALHPFGLDASSRLEIEPGVKDLERVRALVQSVEDRARRLGSVEIHDSSV